MFAFEGNMAFRESVLSGLPQGEYSKKPTLAESNNIVTDKIQRGLPCDERVDKSNMAAIGNFLVLVTDSLKDITRELKVLKEKSKPNTPLDGRKDLNVQRESFYPDTHTNGFGQVQRGVKGGADSKYTLKRTFKEPESAANGQKNSYILELKKRIEKLEKTFRQEKILCYSCGQRGHYSWKCNKFQDRYRAEKSVNWRRATVASKIAVQLEENGRGLEVAGLELETLMAAEPIEEADETVLMKKKAGKKRNLDKARWVHIKQSVASNRRNRHRVSKQLARFRDKVRKETIQEEEKITGQMGEDRKCGPRSTNHNRERRLDPGRFAYSVQ